MTDRPFNLRELVSVDQPTDGHGESLLRYPVSCAATRAARGSVAHHIHAPLELEPANFFFASVTPAPAGTAL